MSKSVLVEGRLLDPRMAADAARRPIAGAVNIPQADLPARMHELPSRNEVLRVVGRDPQVSEVVAWLQAQGRRAVAEHEFQFAAAGTVPPTRLWRPNAWLAEVLPQLSPGAALDLGCGTGRDAVYLASCGWCVTAVDILPDALARGRNLAAQHGDALGPIEWLQMDLECGQPAITGEFDLIVSFRYLHRPILHRCAAWLRPGGSVLIETFTASHRARHGRPSRDAHIVQAGELPGLLPGLEVRQHSEAWRGDQHTARIWAQKR